MQRGLTHSQSSGGVVNAVMMSLVQVGESSAARQALEGAPVVPGTMATLTALRPPLLRELMSRAVLEAQPAEQFELDWSSGSV